MIEARFNKSGEELVGFSVTGHAGYDIEGFDIVCASVSSAVMLTCNAITEVFGIRADISAEDNLISCKTAPSADGSKLIESLLIHLTALSEEYPENVTVKISEV